jgi:hypothetical protein
MSIRGLTLFAPKVGILTSATFVAGNPLRNYHSLVVLPTHVTTNVMYGALLKMNFQQAMITQQNDYTKLDDYVFMRED